MLAVTSGLLLLTLCAPGPLTAPPASGVQTATVSDDPFESLWVPGEPGAVVTPQGAESDAAPGASPRTLGAAGPGSPRLELSPSTPATAPPMSIRTETVRRWYRWPIVISDSLFSILALVGFGLENAPMAAVGTLGYGFSAPVWHWKNGNVNSGLLSMTMHSFGPAAVGLLTAIFGAMVQGPNCSGSCGNDRVWFFTGAALGAIATTAMDAFVLAYVDEPNPDLTTLGPVIGRSGETTVVGIGGRF